MSPFISYFAYGSNLTHSRLVARIGMCQVRATATLSGYRLAFHKRGADGSAKCDAHHTGDSLDRVRGVVYEITAEQKAVLDRYEGVGFGYAMHTVEAVVDATSRAGDMNGGAIRTLIYLAQSEYVDPRAVPFSWYRDFVAEGARRHGLPAEYVGTIEAVTAVQDPDRRRHRENARILTAPLDSLVGASGS